MSPTDLRRLGEFIRERRENLGISRRELARRAEIADVGRLEQGLIASPRTDTLQAIGTALGLSLSELVSLGEPSELPGLMPYMRAKYADMPDAAIQEVAAYVEQLRAKHDLRGPADHEDEIEEP